MSQSPGRALRFGVLFASMAVLVAAAGRNGAEEPAQGGKTLSQWQRGVGGGQRSLPLGERLSPLCGFLGAVPAGRRDQHRHRREQDAEPQRATG